MSLICVFVMQWAGNLSVRIGGEFGRITVRTVILTKATVWTGVTRKSRCHHHFVRLAVIPNMQATCYDKKTDFILPL